MTKPTLMTLNISSDLGPGLIQIIRLGLENKIKIKILSKRKNVIRKLE